MSKLKSYIFISYFRYTVILIMSTRLIKEQKIAVLKWFWKALSVTFVQQEFRRHFQSKPLTYPVNISLVKQFDLAGTVENLPRSGRSVTATTAEHRTDLVAAIFSSFVNRVDIIDITVYLK